MKRFIRRHPVMMSFLLVILILIAYGVYRSHRPKTTPIRLAKVEKETDLKAVVKASGEIRAHDVVDIQTEVAGVIVELPVKEGQTVKKGDILLKIDPFAAQTDLSTAKAHRMAGEADVKRMDTSIATAQANLARMKQQLKSTEVDAAEAEITHKRDLASLVRMKSLVDQKVLSPEEFEQAQTKADLSAQAIESSKAALEQMKAQVKTATLAIEEQHALKAASEQNLAASEAALSRASDQLSKVTITAPIDGTIIRLNVDIGERAVPGIQSNPQATLMTLADTRQIEAEIQVDETDIVRTALGNKAIVDVDALEDKPLSGTITEIGSAPIQTSSSSNNQEGKDFKVVIAILDPPDSLRIGMSCEATITVDSRSNILVMPIQALTSREVDTTPDGKYAPPPKPEKPGKTVGTKVMASQPESPKRPKKPMPGVFIIGEDGMAHFRPVKVGIMGESKVEILDGLKQGEQVIIGPLSSLRILDEWTLVKEAEPGPIPGEDKGK